MAAEDVAGVAGAAASSTSVAPEMPYCAVTLSAAAMAVSRPTSASVPGCVAATRLGAFALS
jgi:hypothetical protein